MAASNGCPCIARSNTVRSLRSPRIQPAPSGTSPLRPRLQQVTSWPCLSSNATMLVLILPVPPMTQILMRATLLRDGRHASWVSPPPFQRLPPFRAFRLTPSHTWSTDTSAHTPISVGRGACPPAPNCSYGRAGGHTHALPELWL